MAGALATVVALEAVLRIEATQQSEKRGSLIRETGATYPMPLAPDVFQVFMFISDCCSVGITWHNLF